MKKIVSQSIKPLLPLIIFLFLLGAAIGGLITSDIEAVQPWFTIGGIILGGLSGVAMAFEISAGTQQK